MPQPQIYIGTIPDTLLRRRAIRALAQDLRTRLRLQRDPGAILALLHLPISGAGIADLLIARPNALILATIATFDGPIEIRLNAWRDMNGIIIQNSEGQTPLAEIGLQRDTLRARLLEMFDPDSHESGVVQRMLATVICSPNMHADSKIALDIDDHRALRKVLGLDELPGLAVMSASATTLSEPMMHGLIEQLGGRLWHDGNRLLFELAKPMHQLQVLTEHQAIRATLPLIEGENSIGRRRTARSHEHRLSISGDDLISSDHAMIICHEDGRIILRDTSKNGTWVTLPGGPETFTHMSERDLQVGTLLRLGETRLVLEEVSV
jgi:FHA domain